MNQGRRKLPIFHLLLMLLLVGCNVFFQFAQDNRINVNDGYGWDGRVYGLLAEDFPTHSSTLAAERARRILPSFVVWKVSQLAGKGRLSKQQVISAFFIANSVLLLASIVLWFGTATSASMGVVGAWAGYFALFWNFSAAKFLFYYPVLLDPCLLFFSTLCFFFCIRKQFTLFALSLIPAVLCSSTIAIWFLPAAVWMDTEFEQPSSTSRSPRILALLVAGVFVVLAVAHNLLLTNAHKSGAVFLPMLLPVSIGLAAAYVYFGSLPLLSGLTLRIRPYLNQRTVFRVVVIAAIFLGTGWLAKEIAGITASGSVLGSLRSFYGSTLHGSNSIPIRSTSAPLVFFVSHVIWFGPIFVLLLLKWKLAVEEMRKLGTGFILFFIWTVGFSLTSESRHILPALPALALVLGRTLERISVSRTFLVTFGVASILVSRFWMHLSPKPDQWYFMNVGPWMKERPYWVSTTLAVVMGVGFYALLRRSDTGQPT